MNRSRDLYHNERPCSPEPGLHESQRPPETPRVRRNLVQNLVAQFNEEAQRRQFRRHHSTDGVRETTTTDEDSSNNHHHQLQPPFSYTGVTQKPSLGSRSRSDYNIRGPPEVIYAQVVVNGQQGGDKRKTTVHTKVVPTRMVESLFGGSKKKLAKSTGSLNMSAEEDMDEEAHRRQLKNGGGDQGSYYRYSGVDENVPHGWRKWDVDRRAPNVKRGLSVPLGRQPDDNYETRNVEKWSEKEEGPTSRKFLQGEYVHEVSVSRDPGVADVSKVNGGGAPPSLSSSLRRERWEENEEIRKSVLTTSNHHNNNTLLTPPESRRQYYFGTEPVKPPRVKWPKQEELTNGWVGGRDFPRHRRGSSDSGTSSGIGLLSSKLVKKAVERYGRDDEPVVGRRVSEGDDDVFGEESRKTFERKEMHTSEHHKTRTTRHHVPRKSDASIVVGRRSASASTDGERKDEHRRTSRRHGAFEVEDRMETSESEPPMYGGSQESRMSLGSRQSLVDDHGRLATTKTVVHDEGVVAAHVNTPQSLLRRMNRRQINYENAQRPQEVTTPTGRRFWFERPDGEPIRHDRIEVDANGNHLDDNNRVWSSATLSRLETSKNRLNEEDAARWTKTSTVDRHAGARRRRAAEEVIGRNATAFVVRNHHHHSENDSQSAGSASSSRNSSPAKPKRVNFKSKSPPPSSGADLSPVHREALMRSASPARAPSVASSARSTESDASTSKSVILHATAVADIPPARQYRFRAANTSPSPPPSSLGVKESRSVRRSFSLLSPWKPRKYKDKYEKQSLKNGSAPSVQQACLEEEENDSSAEKLDALSPLPSDAKNKKKNKKKSGGRGILRRHSMPKDSRFVHFFRRKKEPKS